MASRNIEEIEYEILALSRHITAAVGRSRRDKAVLDGSAYALMSLLCIEGPMSIGTFADVTGLDSSTLNRQTAALLRDNYVQRTPDPDGGLARQFRLTSHGEAVLEAQRRDSCDTLAHTLRDWDEADRAELMTVLRRLNKTIERRYVRPWPRPDGIEIE